MFLFTCVLGGMLFPHPLNCSNRFSVLGDQEARGEKNNRIQLHQMPGCPLSVSVFRVEVKSLDPSCRFLKGSTLKLFLALLCLPIAWRPPGKSYATLGSVPSRVCFCLKSAIFKVLRLELDSHARCPCFLLISAVALPNFCHHASTEDAPRPPVRLL